MKLRLLLLLVFITLLQTGCGGPIDLFGLFYSYSTPDDRFAERDSYPISSDPQPLAALSPVGGKYGFTFEVVSDIHVADTTAAQLVQYLNSYQYAGDLFFLDCGDSSQDGEKAQFQTYRSLMDGSGIPWFSTPGNHDLFNEGWKEYRSIVGRSSYAFPVGSSGTPGSMLVIALDSANGTLGSKQLKWLEGELKSQNGLWSHTVVFTHCQFFSTGLNTIVQYTNTDEIYKLMYLFSTYGVDLVFMGHNHNWDDRHIDGVEYITLDALKKGNKSNSFVRISVDGSSLSWQKVMVSGS